MAGGFETALEVSLDDDWSRDTGKACIGSSCLYVWEGLLPVVRSRLPLRRYPAL